MFGQNLPTTETVKPTGADFNAIFEASFNPNNSRLSQGDGLADRRRTTLVLELHVSMHKQGWENATVINMHPFELRHGMGNLNEMTVSKKKEGEPYAKFVIDKYKVSIRDFGDAKYTPEAVVPTQMAEDISLAFKDYGGVFWYKGDGPPPPEMIAEAGAKQLDFYRRELQTGLDSWSRHKQMKFITHHSRIAAKELFKLGQLSVLPEWVTATRAESEIEICDACGEAIKKSAKKCKFCGFVIDQEWFKANKDRFDTQAISSPRRDANIANTPQVDHGKEALDNFMKEEDPNALNQLKNLDESLSSVKDPDEIKIAKHTPLGSDVKPIEKGKK